MKFGIKKGSSKKITLEMIQERLKSRIEEDTPAVTIFIEECKKLAEEYDCKIIIYPDDAFTYNEEKQELESDTILNAKFTEKRG